jgi:hypothetical protein
MAVDRESDEQAEPLWGAKAIAEEIGRSVRQTYYLLETGQLPARKVGATWVAMRRRLCE